VTRTKRDHEKFVKRGCGGSRGKVIMEERTNYARGTYTPQPAPRPCAYRRFLSGCEEGNRADLPTNKLNSKRKEAPGGGTKEISPSRALWVLGGIGRGGGRGWPP